VFRKAYGNFHIQGFRNTFLQVEGLRELLSLRPRNLAIAFFAFFGVLGYLAWSFARTTAGPWYPADVSRSVYQTTLVGGILVLLGLSVIASILQHLSRSNPSSGTQGSSSPDSMNRSDFASPSVSAPSHEDVEPGWEWDNLLQDGIADPPREGRRDRAQDAAAISATLSRLEPKASESRESDLMDQLSRIRGREGGRYASKDRELAQVLMRLVDEIKPLLVASKKAGLNVPEIRRLMAEATAGRESDLTYRVRLVQQLKSTLEAALVERIAEDLQGVLLDVERKKVSAEQFHAAERTAAEGVAFLDSGNYSAALDRAMKARQSVAQQTAISPMPDGIDGRFAVPSHSKALVGPSIIASVFVALSAMLLPGVGGFLEANYVLNTAAILFVSYGWFFLVLYAVVSIFVMTRLPFVRSTRREASSREW
jgi:hypothetical protein